ncbi:hypothetical protein [Yersinia enterocolitica]|uniref:hypothetical protein n=1 Tax=Yersinia enterocolitica TaxID=630 RepID=UPI0002D37E9F|nr:hypothetical protein [Yersinia enterocolitica]AJJ24033.1 hypothetical protein CH49_1463 [Yersinia enterocolitica]CNF83649.1 Uncharacterised protein [Yersinia enterocolitica]HDL8279400.1 hypothetical protein [Yersinia enterocolitica]HDL8283274.1 hypothetical protein [Yersinia enterocolitica]
MKTRREFLTMVAGLGIVLKCSAPVFAAGANRATSLQHRTGARVDIQATPVKYQKGCVHVKGVVTIFCHCIG